MAADDSANDVQVKCLGPCVQGKEREREREEGMKEGERKKEIEGGRRNNREE
uniref:Uncharacterized protein n=1 Tax=Syphacia muris TaxID=451379 RepID=A0A0N5AZW5_9BILA